MSRWQALQSAIEFSESDTQAILHFPATRVASTFVCKASEKIVFQDEEGKWLWETEGPGQMELPAGTAVWVKNGTAKRFESG
jgi:hypothetical protein